MRELTRDLSQLLTLIKTESLPGRSNGNSNNVSVLLGNGDGTFAAAVNFNVGSSSYSAAIDDFNGDGKADPVVASNEYISVLMGNGDGSFQTAVNYSAVLYTYPTAGITGDFNSDGKLDLAVATYGTASPSVTAEGGIVSVVWEDNTYGTTRSS